MVTHLSYPNVTGSDTPADLSSAIVTDILRDKLGYQNVIITDSQSMSSITDHYSAGEAAVQALAAGCDMILIRLTCRARSTRSKPPWQTAR